MTISREDLNKCYKQAAEADSLWLEESKNIKEDVSEALFSQDHMKVIKNRTGTALTAAYAGMCGKCNNENNIKYRDTSVILTSNPPQYKVTCLKCGDVTYEYC